MYMLRVSVGIIGKRTRQKADKVRRLFRRLGTGGLFMGLMLVGLGVGSALSGRLGEAALKGLDLLFVTNLPDRLPGGAAGAFCASFGSNFLLFAAAFLTGLSIAGVALLPFIALFGGFGLGVSAGYLIGAYGFSGLLFYILVLLPGALVFGAALVTELSAAFRAWKGLLGALFSERLTFREPLRNYAAVSLRGLVLSLVGSAVDTLLWVALAGVIIN